MWRLLTAINSTTAIATANVKILILDPWQAGVCEGVGSNTILPLPSAITAASHQAIISADDALLAIAITSGTLADFSTALTSFNAAFPLPELQRLKRRADKVAELETSKFQLVTPKNQAKSVDLNSLPTLRESYRQQLISESKAATQAFKSSNGQTNLTDFSSAKAARDSAYADIAPPPASVDLIINSAWRFYVETNILESFQQSPAGYEYKFTALLVFIAPPADLSVLTGIFP